MRTSELKKVYQRMWLGLNQDERKDFLSEEYPNQIEKHLNLDEPFSAESRRGQIFKLGEQLLERYFEFVDQLIWETFNENEKLLSTFGIIPAEVDIPVPVEITLEDRFKDLFNDEFHSRHRFLNKKWFEEMTTSKQNELKSKSEFEKIYLGMTIEQALDKLEWMQQYKMRWISSAKLKTDQWELEVFPNRFHNDDSGPIWDDLLRTEKMLFIFPYLLQHRTERYEGLENLFFFWG